MPKPEHPYLDSSLPVEKRVRDLVSRMILEEKIGQLASGLIDNLLDSEELSLEKLRAQVDDLGLGVFHGAAVRNHEDSGRVNLKVLNQVQRYVVENTRLGIPAIMTGESLHGHMSHGATIFPHSITMASSWDPDLLHEVAGAIAKETRAVGVLQTFSPVLDLAREPRWGRCQETYGEDPYLVARMGVAYIKGIQGESETIDQSHCAATAKHFAAHGSPEAGMNISPVHGGPRELRDLYLPPFKAAICEAKVASVMNCYSEYDGIPAAASKELLTEILREEWGFEGYVYSDWDSVEMLHTIHKTAADAAEAGKRAIEAGVDLEAPLPRGFGRNLLEMVKSGQVAEATVDQAVSRVLRLKFLLGLFENPYFDPSKAPLCRDTKEHRELARKMARESIILLKNEGHLLPLNDKTGTIAVIGPNGNVAQTGDYSGKNDNLVSVLDGVRNRVGGSRAEFARGCGIWEPSTEGFTEAVALAGKADVAVVVVGESDDVCSEGNDQADLNLPGVQMELVKAVHATGTPTVVVLMHGRPLAISWIAENVPAILETWYPGEEGGSAIADLLFGDFSPCGKLPVSLPRSTGNTPCYYDHKPSARGIYHVPGAPGKPGRDYVFEHPSPLFEFGFGLSYTEFSYSDLKVSPKKTAPAAKVRVSVTVTNTGKRRGAEVVQLYINDVYSSTTTPVKTLRRFRKVWLEPGEAKTCTFTLGPEDLALLDRHLEWVVEPGEFEVMVGELKGRFFVD